MATESEIKSAIERIVGHYPAWTINPSVWHQWNANTETAARNVERYFLDKGMKGGGGGSGSADYVYIFI